VILLGRLLARLLEKSTEMVMLGWLNKLGGVVIYAFTYTILFSAILFFGTAMNWFESRQLDDSFFVQFLSDLAPNLMETLGAIIPPLKNSFSNLEEFFRAYKG
jgi:membrane protein required for colicin V production